jgi:hypothetical protein
MPWEEDERYQITRGVATGSPSVNVTRVGIQWGGGQVTVIHDNTFNSPIGSSTAESQFHARTWS